MRGVLIAALGAALAACAGTPTPTPTKSAFQPLPQQAARVPTEADRAASDVARAVLRGDAEQAERNVQRVVALEKARPAEAAPSGLVPHALDTAAALEANALLRRRAAEALLERDDLPEPLRTRLTQEVDDDPLRLADARLSDSRQRHVAAVLNGLIQPVGRSLTSAFLLPYRLGQSLLGTALAFHQEDALNVNERQALAHWKRFVERHPETPEAAQLLERIQEAQEEWYRTRRDEELEGAEQALALGEPLRALRHAERALGYVPGDEDARALREEAEAHVRVWREGRARSLRADPEAPLRPAAERPVAVALLAGGDVAGAAQALLAAEGEDGALADEARLALALAEARAGREQAAWETLEELADEDVGEVSAARHAEALVESPQRNPARAFDRAERAVASEAARWVLLGPLAHGARDRDLPRPLEWLVEIPALAGVVLGLPNRLIRAPFMELDWDAPAVLARRYLERFPDGERAAEMREWLVEFESERGNQVGALRLYAQGPASDEERLAELREDAAEQALEASRRERRLDVRARLLRRTASRFPDTEAGAEAGRALRELHREASAQQIRVSRGFLREHPRVAGPQGLALEPSLLDERLENGELHPEGVTLLGGREVELAFVAPSGRESDEPERVRERISEERLERLVALLTASQEHLILTDRDAEIEHDADRDRFFERARLGLADRPDLRPGARSSYQYLGMREKYGLVRGRESILPVELVLQGSFDDFGLGAFPRIRMPKPTPDAFLYQ